MKRSLQLSLCKSHSNSLIQNEEYLKCPPPAGQSTKLKRSVKLHITHTEVLFFHSLSMLLCFVLLTAPHLCPCLKKQGFVTASHQQPGTLRSGRLQNRKKQWEPRFSSAAAHSAPLTFLDSTNLARSKCSPSRRRRASGELNEQRESGRRISLAGGEDGAERKGKKGVGDKDWSMTQDLCTGS